MLNVGNKRPHMKTCGSAGDEARAGAWPSWSGQLLAEIERAIPAETH